MIQPGKMTISWNNMLTGGASDLGNIKISVFKGVPYWPDTKMLETDKISDTGSFSFDVSADWQSVLPYYLEIEYACTLFCSKVQSPNFFVARTYEVCVSVPMCECVCMRVF